MVNKHTALMLFSKVPVPGEVKTRLISALGKQGAAELHQAMLCYLLDVMATFPECTLELWLAGQEQLWNNDISTVQTTIHRQQGKDLGERLELAFQMALTEHIQAVVIGADCIAISPKEIAWANAQLSRGKQAVIIPADDGGYVLLGLRTVDRTLFEGIDWGSEKVFEQTTNRMQQLGWDYAVGEKLWDIDRPDDLELLKTSPNTDRFYQQLEVSLQIRITAFLEANVQSLSTFQQSTQG